MSRSEPQFSVVIPTFNYAKTLPVAIESILGQARNDVQVIVIDDASTDDTRQIVRQYDDSIEYIRNDSNLGPGGAWAVGLAKAAGDYVTKLDADDWILPDFFEHVGSSFDAKPEVGLVIGSAYDFNADRGRTTINQVCRTDQILAANELRERLLNGFFFRMPSVALRRSCFVNQEPPRSDLRLPHDWEFLLRVSRGWACQLLAEPIAVYRVHSSSLTRTAIQTESLQSDYERMAELVGGPEYEARFTEIERRVLLGSMAQTYLRIAGSGVSLGRAAVDSPGHLLFAARLAMQGGRLEMLRLIRSAATMGAEKVMRTLSPNVRSKISADQLLPKWGASREW